MLLGRSHLLPRRPSSAFCLAFAFAIAHLPIRSADVTASLALCEGFDDFAALVQVVLLVGSVLLNNVVVFLAAAIHVALLAIFRDLLKRQRRHRAGPQCRLGLRLRHRLLALRPRRRGRRRLRRARGRRRARRARRASGHGSAADLAGPEISDPTLPDQAAAVAVLGHGMPHFCCPRPASARLLCKQDLHLGAHSLLQLPDLDLAGRPPPLLRLLPSGTAVGAAVGAAVVGGRRRWRRPERAQLRAPAVQLLLQGLHLVFAVLAQVDLHLVLHSLGGAGELEGALALHIVRSRGGDRADHHGVRVAAQCWPEDAGQLRVPKGDMLLLLGLAGILA
mmetsp:Transcript_29560/g.97908  ORF Transcript_29560/g.97908 Transcript_29560/m.97908 type:complete len:335 (-) Transcript_29560:1121-2125(-)